MDNIKDDCLEILLKLRKQIKKEKDENILYELHTRLEEFLSDYF